MQTDIATGVDNAFIAAQVAARQKIQENPGQWYPCGFSWVTIKPARGPLAEHLKKLGLGQTSSNGGLTVYNPSNNSTQWMDAKDAGSRAFAAALELWLLANPQKTKYTIYRESRVD